MNECAYIQALTFVKEALTFSSGESAFLKILSSTSCPPEFRVAESPYEKITHDSVAHLMKRHHFSGQKHLPKQEKLFRNVLNMDLF